MRLLRVVFLSVLILNTVAQAQTDGCSAEKATLLSPSLEDDGVQSPVIFRWSEVEGAAGYRVWIIEDELDLDVIAETPRTFAAARVGPGEHAWFVETLFPNCETTRSEIHLFEVPRAESCPTLAPTPLTPGEGAQVGSRVTFSWTPVPGAIGYEVSASLDDGEPVFVGETPGTTLTASLGEGHVRWEVEAEFNGCDETISPEASFDIPVDPGCAHDAPLLIAPALGVDTPTRVDFIWTPVPEATSYRVLLLTDEHDDVRTLGTTSSTRLNASVPAGPVFWAVVAEFESCPPEASPISLFEARTADGCRKPDSPEIYLAPQALSGSSFTLLWSPEANSALYEVQESTRDDFLDASTRLVSDIQLDQARDVSRATRFYYRVRAMSSCGFGVGPYSKSASIVVVPPIVALADQVEIAASYGEQSAIVQKVRLAGLQSPVSFAAQFDKPWLTVSPTSGTIPPEGLDLTVTARPQDLPIGTNTATLILTDLSSRKLGAGSTTKTTVPVSVSLATPVSPNAGNSPLPHSLIIPAVAHVSGPESRFESDVRIANTSAQVMEYLLSFTPTRTEGTKHGQQTTIQIEPGETVALDNIMKNFYGFAQEGDNVIGMLEIRPMMTSSTLAPTKTPNVTFASSRTFGIGPVGTYGQYIPAIPFSQFVGQSSDDSRSVLSLSQIAQSAFFRTNLGLLEAAGEPATVRVRLFGDDGKQLLERVVQLRPGEHFQAGDLFPGHTVGNGRVEVEVMSPTGKVSAYASVLDNESGDPTLVLPVDVSRVRANRIVLPGIADLDTGAARWRSDIRIHNAGASDAEVVLMYIPQGDTHGPQARRTIRAGEELRIDDALRSFFNVTNGAGSVLVTTGQRVAVVASARTYNQTDHGTYGQFIPGVTPADGVGVEDRALQILQIEQSQRFRTNLGVVELTGKPVTVEISAVTPGSKAATKMRFSLQANEFRQINSVLEALGLPATYNARIALKVVDGDGVISGYASLIDKRTNDPTYVPAQ